MGVPQSPYGHLRKKSFAPAWIGKADRPAHSLVTTDQRNTQRIRLPLTKKAKKKGKLEENTEVKYNQIYKLVRITQTKLQKCKR
jgi:hypothetical protein